MSVLSAVNSKGNLTTSVVILRTATGVSEALSITFRNIDTVNRTITVYENGDTANDALRTIILQPNWYAVVRIKLATSSDVRAKCDSGTSVLWFIDEDVLT